VKGLLVRTESDILGEGGTRTCEGALRRGRQVRTEITDILLYQSPRFTIRDVFSRCAGCAAHTLCTFIPNMRL